VRRTLLLGLVLVVSCSRAPPKPVAAPAPSLPPDTVAIRVEHLPPGDGWKVTWRLPHPVRQVRLARPGNGERKGHWILGTPGLSIVTADGMDRVVSSGEPFDAFQAIIVQYTRKPEKDYQAFIPFDDGTMLLYTGILDLEPPPAEGPWRHDFELVPRKGDAVVVGGARTQGTARWSTRGPGTYVAFGNTPLQETPLGLAMVDGGMPSWLRDRTLFLAVRVFGHYAVKTGWRLDQRPTFFLSYGRLPDPGALSFGGGTLDGVVQLDARMGSRYEEVEDPVVWERQARMVAHEAAHLWLSHMFRPADGSSRWLDEGGADAWALRALLDLNVLTRTRFREILSQDQAECLALLQEGPLVDAARAGRWTAIYRCGEVANFLTEAAGIRRDPPWDVLQFWGQVFFDARNGTYDEALWLDTLAGLPGGPRVVGVVRRMSSRPDAALAGDVQDLFQLAK